MRFLFATLALLCAAAPARAGGAEDFFLGRPPSVGVVQGGAFGLGGSDYADEERGPRFRAPRAAHPRPRRDHPGRVARARQEAGSAVVPRPYFRP